VDSQPSQANLFGETETLVLTNVTCSQEAGYGDDISKNNYHCKIIELLLLMSEGKACLIFIFLVSVSPHKCWGIFRFITVRLHEIFHLTRTLFILSKGKVACRFPYYFLGCFSDWRVPACFTSP